MNQTRNVVEMRRTQRSAFLTDFWVADAKHNKLPHKIKTFAVLGFVIWQATSQKFLGLRSCAKSVVDPGFA